MLMKYFKLCCNILVVVTCELVQQQATSRSVYTKTLSLGQRQCPLYCGDNVTLLYSSRFIDRYSQLGVVAHSCDSASGELGLWTVVGWEPLDEAGHVELVSALSLVSTWAPSGSRR